MALGLLAAALLARPAPATFGDAALLDDPRYPSAWPLDNRGQDWPLGCPSTFPCTPLTPDADMDWAEAYDLGFTGEGVVIALAAPTSGPTVMCDNADLVGRLWVNPGEAGPLAADGLDNDGNGFIDDVHGASFSTGDGDVCLPGTTTNHDTTVARLAVAEANTTQGVGVAPGASLMLLRWTPDLQNRLFYQQVLPYAEAHGARVLVVPYAAAPIGTPSVAACASIGTAFGVDRPQLLADSDVVVLWGRPEDEYPSCDPSALAVAHTDGDDLSLVSSIFTDVAVPGATPPLPSVTESWALGHVAGVLALLAEQDPARTRAELIQRLEDSTDLVGPFPYPGGRNDAYGYGRVNAFTALMLGDVDGDGVDGDGGGNLVVGDEPCLNSSLSCDDNCPHAPNPAQADGGGIGAGSGPDGIGDACQCGDLTDDGTLSATDVDALRGHLVGLPPPGTALGKCNVVGEPGGDPLLCGLDDLVALRRALAFLAPDPDQICGAALP